MFFVHRSFLGTDLDGSTSKNIYLFYLLYNRFKTSLTRLLLFKKKTEMTPGHDCKYHRSEIPMQSSALYSIKLANRKHFG